MTGAPRIVSLVPSLTEAVAELGLADQLVGATAYCVHGTPEHVVRVSGTKYPDLDRVLALQPDVVLANTEENRASDLDALREAGVDVLETFPRRVADVPGMLRALGERLGAPDSAERLAVQVEEAISEAQRSKAGTPVAALCLVWRKPWMGAGPDTYIDDLLGLCGFANVLSGFSERYPRLDPAFELGPEIVILPSEPYRFDEMDLEAVRQLVGYEPLCRFVDGELLTWHGPRTAVALRTFCDLAESARADINPGPESQ